MPKPILDYRDDDSPLWPARCRGYLEGKRASDCLASVELARLRRGPCDICRNWYREVDRLRAENERLRAALAPFAVVADYLPDDLPADTVALTTPDEFQPWDIRAKYVYGARAALKAEP